MISQIVLLLALVYLLNNIIGGVEGIMCRQDERQALLDLKKATQDLLGDDPFAPKLAHNEFYGWVKWEEQQEECCHWQGVVCHPASGHVTQLRLPSRCGAYRYNDYDSKSVSAFMPVHCEYACGPLPASLSRLKSLEVLDLQGGCFSGAVSFRHTFSPLVNLSYLDLSSNPFLHFIPELPLLPHLIYLNLSNLVNLAAGFNLSKLVVSVPNLQYLDLGKSYQPLHQIEQISCLRNLLYLDLSGNFFFDPVPWPSLANLSHLSHLALGPDVVWPAANVHWQCNWKALESLLGYRIQFASNTSVPFCLDRPAVVTELKHLTFRDAAGSIGPLLRSLSLPNSSLSLKSLSLPRSALQDFEADSSQPPTWLQYGLDTPFLEVLDLSDNELTGIPFWLPHLPLLHSLDISHNNLSTFPLGLELLPSLKSLDISYNLLEGPLDRLEPSNTSQWERLILSNNLITGALPLFLLKPSLLYLDVSYNLLSEPLPLSLGNLSSLSYLDLSSNSLKGVVPLSIGRLCNLSYLGLYANSLMGEIPLSIGNLSRLATLYLSSNSLKGEIPRSIGNLSSLTVLDLSGNSLSGDIPLTIGKMSNLVNVGLSSNMLSGIIPPSIGNLSSLITLSLWENNLSGTIPTGIFQNSLSYLDLSRNHLVGGLPLPYMMQTCASLSVLNVYNNNLSGSVAVLLDALGQNCPLLMSLDLSSNRLSGKLSPINSLHMICNQLMSLDLSKNQIWGEIPREMGNCSSLSSLQLSNNHLSGSIPVRELCNNMPDLFVLSLFSNNLSGTLPAEIGNCSGIGALTLGNNALSLDIHASLGKLQSLVILSLHNNKFNGGIPTGIQNCSSLMVLDLSFNQLSGPIPEWIKGETFPDLQVLMLSSNQLRSSMPELLPSLVTNMTKLRILGLASNYLSGTIPSNVNSLQAMTEYVAPRPNGSVEYYDLEIPIKGVASRLELSGGFDEDTVLYWTILDLSNNQLEGAIPTEIGELKGLYSLNLSRNALNGSIPRSLGALAGFLESLDLSNNKLTGGIPSELCNFDSLGALNLSHNRLQGAITMSSSCIRLCMFDASCYAGNDGLLYECNASCYAGNDGLLYECNARTSSATNEDQTHPEEASAPVHLSLIAKVQERISVAGWGIGHLLGFLLMGLFLYHRSASSY